MPRKILEIFNYSKKKRNRILKIKKRKKNTDITEIL